MRISGTLVLIALPALTMMAGCATSFSGQTQSGAAPTVTSAMLDAPVLNTDVAVMATLKSLAGGVAGAV